jgi:hypothetical protein
MGANTQVGARGSKKKLSVIGHGNTNNNLESICIMCEGHVIISELPEEERKMSCIAVLWRKR